MRLSFSLLFFVCTCQATTISVGGPYFLQGVHKTWWVPYLQYKSDDNVTFNFLPTQGNEALLNTVASESGEYDFGWLDPYSEIPEDAWDHPNYRLFPFLIDTLVTALNLDEVLENQDVVLTREIVADIFMGKITMWNDTSILALNQNLNLPSETITVLYLANNSINYFWSEALSSFSTEWNTTYGTFSVWPQILQNLSNFVAVDREEVQSVLTLTPFSIAYLSPSITSRQEIRYARLINKAGKVVGVDQLTDSMDDVALSNDFRGSYGIDAKGEFAWPLGTYVYFAVSTVYSPDSCERARQAFLFFRWLYTEHLATAHATAAGFGVIENRMRFPMLTTLFSVECDGEIILQSELDEVWDGPLLALLIVSLLLLIVGLFLGAFHMWNFRHSKINLIYTSIFMIGIALTFISPLFWYLEPDDTSICQARIWTLSLGASILLGTMFSRTWQLREIYLLQKKNWEDLKHNVSVRRTLIKLFVTLTVVFSVNFLILVAWTASDPYKTEFVITSEDDLVGDWGCTSENLPAWLGTEISFLLALILFGVYVIYQTWSFQKASALTETRWVLLALYNIILNLVALTPYFMSQTINLDFLSVLLMVSINFSGTGIVSAVLLPRLVEKLEWTHSSKKSSEKQKDGSKLPFNNTKKMIQEHSRTPEDRLADRLANPQPLHLDPKSKERLLQPLQTPVEGVEGVEGVELAPRSPSPIHESRIESISAQVITMSSSPMPPIHSRERTETLDLSMSGGDETTNLVSEHHPRVSLNWTHNPIQE